MATDKTDETWPWSLAERWIGDPDGGPILMLGRQRVGSVASLKAGRRIVAALNAVRHLTTDELESGVVGRSCPGGP